MITALAIAIAGTLALIASACDLKCGEIPDKLNYSLIFSMILLSIIASASSLNADALTNTLAVGTAYFIIAYILYYFGQWGGGDVKMLAGIGCALGLINSQGYVWSTPLMPYYLTYFIDMGFIVLPYALAYMLILSVSNTVVFRRFMEGLMQKRTAILLLTAFSLPIILYYYTKFPFFVMLSPVLAAFIISSIFLKTSEEILLTKTILVSELKEYDALGEDIVCDGQKIALRREIEGLTKEQADLIKKLALEGKIPDKIMIRWGVRFGPIILIAFLLTLYAGDLMALAIKALV